MQDFVLFISAVSVLVHLAGAMVIPHCEITRRLTDGNTRFICSCSSPKWYKNGVEIDMETELEEAIIIRNIASVMFNNEMSNLSHEANWTCSNSDGALFSENLPYFGE